MTSLPRRLWWMPSCTQSPPFSTCCWCAWCFGWFSPSWACKCSEENSTNASTEKRGNGWALMWDLLYLFSYNMTIKQVIPSISYLRLLYILFELSPSVFLPINVNYYLIVLICLPSYLTWYAYTFNSSVGYLFTVYYKNNCWI